MSELEIDALAQRIAEALYIKYGYHSVPLMKQVIVQELRDSQSGLKPNEKA